MRSDNIEDLMAMDWIPEISQEEDGNVTLRIPGLKGFVVHGSPEDAVASFSQALRNHLSSYLAAGKAVPVPEGRSVQDTSRTSGDPWQHLRVNVLTGHMRTRSATAGATRK